MLELWGLFYL